MTTAYSPVTLPDPSPTDDAYAEFWHAMEDDGAVTSFDEEDVDAEPDADDVYFAFVSSIEA